MTDTEFERTIEQQATIMAQQAEILRLRQQVRTLEAAYAMTHAAYVKRTQLALGASLVRFIIADKV
jgi:hypothetical protein